MAGSYKNVLGSALNPSGATLNNFQGTDGSETINGTSGNDAFIYSGGIDTYIGGKGDDAYFLTTAKALVVENAGEGTDSIHVYFSYTLPDNVENLYLDGPGARYGGGNALANLIVGSADNQTLDGGLGDDVLVGGGKNAIFVEAAGNGSDAVQGWDASDRIRLDGYGLTSFDQVQSLMKQVGADTQLTFANGEQMVLRGVQASSLTADNFMLSIDTTTMSSTFDDEFNTLDVASAGGAWNLETQLKQGQAEYSIEPTYKGTSTTALGLNPYSINDGVVTITASPTPEQDKQYLDNAAYVSGTMNTHGTFSQEYGYFEIRAQMPAGDALWPAFWLLPANGSWPPELDVFEQLGQDPSTIYMSVLAGLDANGARIETHEVINVDTTQYHTYGVDWEPDYITFYIDGVAVGKEATPASMHQEMYLIANLSVGDNAWLGSPDSTTGTAAFNIDYIRAYATANTVSVTVDGVQTILNADAAASTNLAVATSSTWGVDGTTDVASAVANTVDAADAATVAGAVAVASGGATQVTGTANADSLIAKTAHSELWGNAGNDTLNGGGVDAVLHGGSGDDVYVITAAGETAEENAGEGYDTVYSSVSFTLGANLESLVLQGSGDINATGNDTGDHLVGSVGNNVITGGAGNDTLDGGSAGQDTLIGGKGDDVYNVGHAGTTIVENAGEGYDTVYSSVSFTLGANLESLVLQGSGDINATGNDAGDHLVGNDGSNVITGGAGNDTLDGGSAGQDTLIGGKGDDIYNVGHAGTTLVENAGEGYDTVYSSISWTLGANFENLVLQGSADLNATGNDTGDHLVGNDGSNVITGGAGNDTLNGGAGNDRLDGGSAGQDLLLGGAGDDIYTVGHAGVTIVENAGEGYDTVYSSVSFALGANIENLVLFGSSDINATGNDTGSHLVGNDGSNVITGGSGNDTLDGGSAGQDTLIGGKGDDVYNVSHAGTMLIESAGEGYDTVYSSIGWTLGANFENLVLYGSAHIDATGNDTGDHLVGNDGSNIITGGAGNDTLDGGSAGQDMLIGGKGDDIYIVSHAGTTLVEHAGEGYDTVYSSISWTLGADFENLALQGSADISATGNDTGDRLVGNGGNNVITGGAGNDTLIGGAGSDTFRFLAQFGHDVVADFNSSEDYLSFTGHDRSQMHLTQVGSDLVIDFGGSDTVVLLNEQANDANLLSHILF